jgi:STE24 endopeptidase
MVAILAHEVGHNKKKHILKMTIVGILESGLVLLLLSLFINSSGLYQAFYMEHESIYAGLLFFGLLYTPLQQIILIFTQIFSRKNEYEADKFAVKTIDNPQNFISALKKLSAGNLSNLTPHPFYVFVYYSHPPLLQRIKAIQGIEHELETAQK